MAVLLKAEKLEQEESGKVAMCVHDAEMAQKDIKDILDMLQTEWDTNKFLMKMLDLSVRVQELFDKCRSISAQDIFDYMAETKKDCFEKIQSISQDISTIFVKQDVTLQELINAAQDIEQKFPAVYQSCFAQLKYYQLFFEKNQILEIFYNISSYGTLQQQYNLLHELQRDILKNIDQYDEIQFDYACKQLDEIKIKKQGIKQNLEQQNNDFYQLQQQGYKIINAKVAQSDENICLNTQYNQQNKNVKYHTFADNNIDQKFQPQIFPFNPIKKTFYKIDKVKSSDDPNIEYLSISQTQYKYQNEIQKDKPTQNIKIQTLDIPQQQLVESQLQEGSQLQLSQQQSYRSSHFSQQSLEDIQQYKRILDNGSFKDQIHPSNLNTYQLYTLYQIGQYDEIMNNEEVCQSERDLLEELYIRKILNRFFPQQKMNYGAIHYLIQKKDINQQDYDYLQNKIYKQTQQKQNIQDSLISEENSQIYNSEQDQSIKDNKNEDLLQHKSNDRKTNQQKTRHIQIGSKYDINVIEEEPSQEFETSKYYSKEDLQDTLYKIQRSKDNISNKNYSYKQIDFQSSEKKNITESQKQELSQSQGQQSIEINQTPRFPGDKTRDSILKDINQKSQTKKFKEDNIDLLDINQGHDSQQDYSNLQTSREVNESNGVYLLNDEKIKQKDLRIQESNRSLQNSKSKNLILTQPQNIFKQKLSTRSIEDNKINSNSFANKNLLSNSSNNERSPKNHKNLNFYHKQQKDDYAHNVSDSEVFAHNFSFKNQLIGDLNHKYNNVNSLKEIKTVDQDISDKKLIDFLKLKIHNLQSEIQEIQKEQNNSLLMQQEQQRNSQNFLNQKTTQMKNDQILQQNNQQNVNQSIDQYIDISNQQEEIEKLYENNKEQQYDEQDEYSEESREFVSYTIGKSGNLVPVYQKKISLQEFDFTKQNYKQQIKEIEARNIAHLQEYNQKKNFLEFKNKYNTVNNQ